MKPSGSAQAPSIGPHVVGKVRANAIETLYARLRRCRDQRRPVQQARASRLPLTVPAMDRARSPDSVHLWSQCQLLEFSRLPALASPRLIM